jgi:hypothetical protein
MVVERRAAEAELLAIAASLGTDEVRVLCFVAARLLEGQARYGVLDVAHDRRNFRYERAEELADALVYGALDELRRVMAVPGGNRE